MLFIWVDGGLTAEKHAAKVFDGRVKACSKDLGWATGCLFIGEPIPIEVSKEFEVKREPLLDWAKEVVQQNVSKRDIEQLCKI